jgi:hypothetical protein
VEPTHVEPTHVEPTHVEPTHDARMHAEGAHPPPLRAELIDASTGAPNAELLSPRSRAARQARLVL